MHLLAHWAGLDNLAGPFYGFWSGIGSDLAYLGVFGLLFHHLNCHQEGCWRTARHQMGGYCRKHYRP